LILTMISFVPSPNAVFQSCLQGGCVFELHPRFFDGANAPLQRRLSRWTSPQPPLFFCSRGRFLGFFFPLSFSFTGAKEDFPPFCISFPSSRFFQQVRFPVFFCFEPTVESVFLVSSGCACDLSPPTSATFFFFFFFVLSSCSPSSPELFSLQPGFFDRPSSIRPAGPENFFFFKFFVVRFLVGETASFSFSL